MEGLKLRMDNLFEGVKVLGEHLRLICEGSLSIIGTCTTFFKFLTNLKDLKNKLFIAISTHDFCP